MLIQPVDRKEFEERVFPFEFSAVVFKEGDKYYAKDGKTGNVVYVDTDASNVIQYAIDNIPLPGGTLLIKTGDYYLSKAIRITKHINLVGEGVGATRLMLAPNANSRIIEYCIDPNVINIYTTIQPHMYIAHMYIGGNRKQQTSGSEAIITKAEGNCARVADWLLFNVWISSYKGHGVTIKATHNWLILHSSIEHNDGNAVNLDGANEGMVGFSLIYNNLNGIYVNNVYAPVRIIGNRIEEFTDSGININSSRFVIAVGNYIIPGTSKPKYYIYINDSIYNIIANNILGVGSVNIPDYGIYEYGTSNYNILANNVAGSANIEPIRLVGANSKAVYNYARIGTGVQLPSVNSNVATITAGSTRVTVSHGLYKEPGKVLITPIGQPPGKLWVENITATSFDIVTDTAPTADLKVAWYAEV